MNKGSRIKKKKLKAVLLSPPPPERNGIRNFAVGKTRRKTILKSEGKEGRRKKVHMVERRARGHRYKGSEHFSDFKISQ